MSTSQPKYAKMVDPVNGDAVDHTDPRLARPRSWQKGVCDCSHWCSGGCLTWFFCMPCSIFCCLPHSLSAMARKINWSGFAKSYGRSYRENRKTFCLINATILICYVITFAVEFTVLRGIAYNQTQNQKYAKQNAERLQDCEQFRSYDYSRYEECVKDASEGTHVVGTTTSVLPIMILLVISSAACALVTTLFLIYLMLLRYNMRKNLNIKPLCCTSLGDVGGAFEDLICLSSCLFPCALSQMHDEVNVEVEYCCGGQDPGHVDANLVV